MMRVAIAGVHTETNTFLPARADLTRFEDIGVFRGEQIVREYDSALNTITGFLETCREHAVEVVPILTANAWACGTITASAFEHLAREILEALRAEGPFDVVLLAQHGAAVAEEHPDADGELAARIRALVGPGVTVAVGLDLHGNITPRLIDTVDVAVGYRDNPHTDPVLRGAECAALALRHARRDVQLVQRLVCLPMVVPLLGGWTSDGPMRKILREADRIAAEHSLLSYTVFHGFGYADVPQLGSSVLAVADRDATAAEQGARAIAQALWSRREDLRGAALEPATAVMEANRRARGKGPTVVLDIGDNIGGGAPGDSTVLLAEALAQEVHGFGVAICDELAVQKAIAAGEGALAELEIGHTTPVSVGPRVHIKGLVTRITDGRFEDARQTHGGYRVFNGGPTVRLTTDAGQEIVLNSLAVPPFSPEQFRAVDIEPAELRVLVAKGVVAPRAGYEPIASGFILADTPGVTVADLGKLDYSRRPSVLWPFEPDAEFLVPTRRTVAPPDRC